MSDWAADERDLARTGKLKIRNILAASPKEAVIFLAQNCGAHCDS